MSFEIRPATQDERDRFVRSTWRRTFASPKAYTASPWVAEYFGLLGSEGGMLSKQLWLDAHATMIDGLLARSSVAVAHVDDECLGWVAWSPAQLHYVYVASSFRREGVGAALLRHAIANCDEHLAPSHLTIDGEALFRSVHRQQRRATDDRQQRQSAHDG